MKVLIVLAMALIAGCAEELPVPGTSSCAEWTQPDPQCIQSRTCTVNGRACREFWNWCLREWDMECE